MALLVGVGGAAPDVSIGAALTMLHLQTNLMVAGVRCEVHFVDSLADALAEARKRDADLFAIDASVAVTPQFVTRCMSVAPKDRAVILAPYPVGRVDWDRVVRLKDSTEPARFRGLTYSATPRRDDAPSVEGYVRARPGAKLGCVFVRRGADLAAIDAAGEAVIDLQSPAVHYAPMAFQGCVGLRSQLR